MARGARDGGEGIEVDEDDFVDDDHGQTEAEAAVADVLDQLGASAKVSVKLRRELRPGDESVPGVNGGYCGRLNKLNAETFEEDIFKLHGGGIFWMEFYSGGVYVKGKSVRIEIDGPPKPKGASPAPSPSATAATDASHAGGALTLADVERLLAQKAKDEALARIERENAELRARLNNPPPAAPVVPPVSPTELVNTIFAKVTEMDKLKEKARETLPPEVQEMRDQLKRANEKIEAQERREQERRERDAKDAQARLEASIAALAAKVAKKPKQNIADTFASEVMGIVKFRESMKLLRDVGEDDEDPEMGDFVKELTKPLLKKAKEFFAKAGKDAAKNATEKHPNVPANVDPKAPNAAELEREAWREWVNAVIAQPALVGDVVFVRKSLERFPVNTKALLAVSSKPELIALVRDTVGAEQGAQAEGAPDALVQRILGTIAQMRDTVQKVASTPAQPPTAEASDSSDDDEGEDEEEEEADAE
jgi:hypothetical protein